MKAPAPITRRGFLSAGAAAFAAPHLVRLQPATNDRFVTFINLLGGNDALNTLVPTRLQAYARIRPTLRIEPTVGLSLASGPYATQDYVLHPALPTLARLYREGYVAFVRMVGYPNPNQSHFESQDIWSRGYRTGVTLDSGWIARYKDLYARDAINVVALGLSQQLDFLGGETPSTFSLLPDRRPPYQFNGDVRYPANERQRHILVERIAGEVRAEGMLGRARLAQLAMYEQQREQRRTQPPPVRPEYPTSGVGLVLNQSALMLRQQKPVKIFYALGGSALDFDTHSCQGAAVGPHADALRDVDAALLAYVSELQQEGMWNRAAIVIFSEFGRRNAAIGNGTDHGAGGLMIVIGGAVRGGMFGPDLTEGALNAFNLPVEVDFRTVFEELLARHFEVDPAPVFTEAYTRRPPLGLIL